MERRTCQRLSRERLTYRFVFIVLVDVRGGGALPVVGLVEHGKIGDFRDRPFARRRTHANIWRQGEHLCVILTWCGYRRARHGLRGSIVRFWISERTKIPSSRPSHRVPLPRQ